MLAQVGAVTLPPATAEKVYAGSPLSDAEKEMVARVPAITERILGKIPRLESALQILSSYSRRFDSGATDGAVPIGARMLRIAVDYHELEAQGMGERLALETLRGREGVYDLELLTAFARVVGAGAQDGRVTELPLSDLRVKMTLAEDVRAVSGQLLISRGSAVTPALLERLRYFQPGYVREPLRVIGGREEV
jgi:hypothetical protein